MHFAGNQRWRAEFIICLLFAVVALFLLAPAAQVKAEPLPISNPIAVEGPSTYNMTIGEFRVRFYENTQSEKLVVLLHGGLSVADRIFGLESESPPWYPLAEFLRNSGFNVLLPYEYDYSDARESWVEDVAISFMNLRGLRSAYLVGYSAGGTVAANVIVTSNVFEKAVIMNSLLYWNPGATKIFSVASEASGVQIEHLLIYGEFDSTAPVDPNAKVWMENVNPSLGHLQVFAYGHALVGTAAEDRVREQLVSFLSTDTAIPEFMPAGGIAAFSSIAVTLLLVSRKSLGRSRGPNQDKPS